MSSDPITAVFVRDVKPDRMGEFEEWAEGIIQAVRRFDGYLGADVIRPGDHTHPEYVIVIRFDKYEHLRTWMGSNVRQEWLKKSEEMTIGEAYIQEAHGFEP